MGKGERTGEHSRSEETQHMELLSIAVEILIPFAVFLPLYLLARPPR
jgi:hypothetical protein